MPDTWNVEEHRERALNAGVEALRTTLRMPPLLTLSEWADQYRVLSPEATAEAGPWRTDRVPYLREIMDTISGRDYTDITILKCSQSGGTEVLNNAVGYFIDQEPSPMLVIQPNAEPMARAWSRERLTPMLRDCPRLRGKVKDPRSRDSGNTVSTKAFPGGSLAIIGANAPAGLASRPIRVVLADELDRWGTSAGTEGDPLSLAEARTITYRHRRKLVKITTPGNAGESRGEKAWRQSDQRHYHVPCPHCGEEQPLEWRSRKAPDILVGTGPFRLVWDKTITEDGEEIHHPETAAYICRGCEGRILDRDKPAMLAAGRWVKHNPDSKLAGFHISGLLSPWLSWVAVAEAWLAKKDDPEQRKAFYNTVLGLAYQDEGEIPDADTLAHRREEYAAEVPAGVAALTLAVDVQGDRLEAEVRGWGKDEESWLIRFERILGDPAEAHPWAEVEALLNREWTGEGGTTHRITACMVDSGYLTDAVYRWVRPRQRRRVFAYKGAENARSPISRTSRANADGVNVVTVNPSAFKDILFRRLRRPVPGAGYLHVGTEAQTGAGEDFLRQYGGERRIAKWINNRPKVTYRRTGRNEAIDLYVMNLAALRMLPRSYRERLGVRKVRDPKPAPEATPVAEAQPAPTPTRQPTFGEQVLAKRLRQFRRPAGGYSVNRW